MFVRKPNPTLTLIQGQRNSCNLSLYLLGSLFPFSRALSLTHTHWAFPLPTAAFLIRALCLLCVRDNGHYAFRKSPRHDKPAVAVEGRVITFHHYWKYLCECVAEVFSFLRASPICRSLSSEEDFSVCVCVCVSTQPAELDYMKLDFQGFNVQHVPSN